MKKVINKQSIGSILAGFVIFFVIRVPFVQAVAGDEDLSIFLATEDVAVTAEEGANGFRQVKYNFRGKDVEVTDDAFTNADPDTEGEFIVWMSQVDGFWQIFLYNIVSETTVQLTTSGNNVNPAIGEDYIAWEGQVDGVWQIFVFDGIRVTQLTQGETPSQDVDVEGKYVVYSQMETLGGGWKVYLHNMENDRTLTLTPDGFGRFPAITNGVVEWEALVGDSSIRYFYDIATDTITTSEPDSSPAPFESTFDVPSFEEFVRESTEITQVTIEDIEEELGIVETPESTESSESVQIPVE